MKNFKNKLFWVTFSFLLFSKSLPAKAFSVNFNSALSVGEVDNNVNASSPINTTGTDNGFGNFFLAQDDPFSVIGSSPSTNISTGNNNLILLSTAVSENIEISPESANQDLTLTFDWAFRGDADNLLDLGIQLDTFTVSLVSAETDLSGNPVVDTDLLLTSSYGEKRGESLEISGGLPVGTYTVLASVVEPDLVDQSVIDQYSLDLSQQTDLVTLLSGSNSAAGFDNLTVSSVPFEFSPASGLLVVSGLWGLLYWKKRRKPLSQLKDLF